MGAIGTAQTQEPMGQNATVVAARCSTYPDLFLRQSLSRPNIGRSFSSCLCRLRDGLHSECVAKSSMIFIAYSRKDESAVDKLERSLQAHGLATLRDRHILESGDDWQKRLELAIRKADAFIVVWSGAAATSRHVAAEISTAVGLDKRVVPCMLDDTPLSSELAARHAIDLENDEAVSKLGQRLAGRNEWLLDQVERAVNRMPEIEGPGPHHVPLDQLLHTPESILADAAQSGGTEGLLDYTEKEIGAALEELVESGRAVERVVGNDGVVRYTFFD